MSDEVEITREQIFAVLQVVTGQDIRKSGLAAATGFSRAVLDEILFTCCGAGLTMPMPSLADDVAADDIMSYRVTERGEAWTLAGGSWDNPIERALDKIEFLIKHRPGAKGTRPAYIDAWETIASTSYKDRERVRKGRAGRQHTRPYSEEQFPVTTAQE